MRAVLDPNVLISGLLSDKGAPAQVLEAWTEGGFELVVSEQLLAELERALNYPKISGRLQADERRELLELLRSEAELVPDPTDPPPWESRDPGDSYLFALGAVQRVPLVSGDEDLLALADDLPIFTPREFLDLITDRPTGSPGS